MKRFATLIVVLALAIRLAVPAGWMPGKEAFELTVCTGVDTETYWLDRDGTLHKSKPHGDDGKIDKPCAFGGMASLAATAQPAEPPTPRNREIASYMFGSVVAVGQGLAAPPPPQTGPPALI